MSYYEEDSSSSSNDNNIERKHRRCFIFPNAESLENRQNFYNEERSKNFHRDRFFSGKNMTAAIKAEIEGSLTEFIENQSAKIANNYSRIIRFSQHLEKYDRDRPQAPLEAVTELIQRRLVYYYFPKYASFELQRESIKDLLLNMQEMIQEPLNDILYASKLLIALLLDENHEMIKDFIFDIYKDTSGSNITDSTLKVYIRKYSKTSTLKSYVDESYMYNAFCKVGLNRRIEFEKNLTKSLRGPLVEVNSKLLDVKITHCRALNLLFAYLERAESHLENERSTLAEYKYSTILGDLIVVEYKREICRRKMNRILLDDNFFAKNFSNLSSADFIDSLTDSELFKPEWALNDIRFLKDRLLDISVEHDPEILMKECERKVTGFFNSRAKLSEEFEKAHKEKLLLDRMLLNLELAIQHVNHEIDDVLKEPIAYRFYLLEYILEKSLWMQEYLRRKLFFLESYLNNYETYSLLTPLIEGVLLKNHTERNFIYCLKSIDKTSYDSSEIINRISSMCKKICEALQMHTE